jgi:hypothetical protein
MMESPTHPGPARDGFDRRSRATALGVLAIVISLLGCAGPRPLATAELDTVEYAKAPPRIDAAVELCLTPELRLRQWNVAEHPFRVELGPRASIHFERLIKQRFADVRVTFGPDCGSTTSRPWITGRIVSAHRELYQEVEDDLQYTAIVFETTLHKDSGELVWEATLDGVVGRPPALGGHALFAGWQKGSVIFFPIDVLATFEDRPRHARAVEDFGAALALALQQTDRALLEATPMLQERLRSEGPPPGEETEAPDALYREPLAPLDPNASDAGDTSGGLRTPLEPKAPLEPPEPDFPRD